MSIEHHNGRKAIIKKAVTAVSGRTAPWDRGVPVPDTELQDIKLMKAMGEEAEKIRFLTDHPELIESEMKLAAERKEQERQERVAEGFFPSRNSSSE